MVPNLLQTSAVLRLTQIEITLAINNIDENNSARGRLIAQLRTGRLIG